MRLVASVVVLTAAALLGPTAGQAQDYYSDIRPLMLDRCAGCHVESGVAWSMEDAERVYARRRSVAEAILDRQMPPWLAAAGHQTYVDDLSLSREQVGLVRAWVEAGYPKGNPRPDPELPRTASAFTVDLSLDVLGPEAYLPDQDNTDDYRCFTVEWPIGETKYLTGFRAVPGNRRVAHHVVVHAVAPGMAARFRELPAAEDRAGYQCFGGAEPDRLFSETARAAYETQYPDGLRELSRGNHWLAHWAPGMDGYAFPVGTGVRMEPGSLLVVQMHYYSAHAPGESDAGTRLDLQLAEDVERPAFHYPLTRGDWLGGRRNGSMVVPAGETATYETSVRLGDLASYVAQVTGVSSEQVEALEVHSANLHMHAYGHSGEITLTDDRGRKETLLSVPRWNLGWQRDFTFQTPKVFRRDDLEDIRLTVTCTYENPTDGPVYGGYGSDEEMCFNFSYIAVRKGSAAEQQGGRPQ